MGQALDRLGAGQLKEQFMWVTALICPPMQEGDMVTSQGQLKNKSPGRAALFAQSICMNPNIHGHH